MNIIKQAPNGTKDILTVAPNRQVIDYLLEYDDNQEMETDVYVNNKKLEHDKDFEYVLKEGDILRIVYRPSVIGTIAAITAVLVLLAVSQTEDYTNSAGETTSSSNNSVSGQSNTVRKYEGIPSICGRVWSYPDLIANSIPEWVSNRKKIRELMLVSEGEVEVHEVRKDTTNIDDISESSYTVYGPDTYPSNLYRISFNSSVSSEELIAPDSSSLIWSGDAVGIDKDISINRGSGSDIEIDCDMCFQSSTGITITNSNTITLSLDYNILYSPPPTPDEDPYGDFTKNEIELTEFNFNLSTGETFQLIDNVDIYTLNTVGTYTVLSSSYNAETEEYTITTNEPLINGVYSSYFFRLIRDRLSVNSQDIVSDLGISSGEFIDIGIYDGSFEVEGAFIAQANKTTPEGSSAFIGTTFVMPHDSSFGLNTYGTSSIQETSDEPLNIIGPYTMSTTAEQVWFNVTATSGLQSNSGGEISVTCTFYVQEIDVNGDDVGTPHSKSVTLTNDNTSQVGETVKITGLGGISCKVYAIRETTTFSGSAIQDITWEDVFTVNEYSGSSFGDVTVIDVTTQSSTSSNNGSINLDVTRMIDGVSTTNFADYVVYYITEKGGYPLSYVNTEELYEISDSLSDDLKEFSYTFDDANLTLAQIVQAICDVARVTCYRDGQQWRFSRDEAKERTYMFNRRNLASGDNQAITLSTRQPQDYDGISLRYYNRVTEDYDNVYVKIDVDTQQFIVGEYGDNLKEIDLSGCANYEQALNRAHLEARKIVYQRKGVEDTALLDASNVSIGERVSWCDIFDGDIFDGEITGQDGTIYYTSEPFRPESGVTYYALITGENSEPLATVEVAENPDDEKSFIATLADAVLIADNYEIQAGSRYIIGSVDDIDDTDYIVMGRGGDSGNGLISLELIQYSNNIYEMD